METSFHHPLILLAAAVGLAGCQAPTVNLATAEPITVDINMRLDVYQYNATNGQKPSAAQAAANPAPVSAPVPAPRPPVCAAVRVAAARAPARLPVKAVAHHVPPAAPAGKQRAGEDEWEEF